MTEERKPILSVDLAANGGSFSFKDADEVLAFVIHEVEFWNFFINGVNNSPAQENLKAVAGELSRKFRSITAEATRFKNEGLAAPQLASQMAGVWHFEEPNLGGPAKPPLSRTPDAQFIRELYEQEGIPAAAGAVAAAIGSSQIVSLLNRPDALRGILAFINFKNGLSQTIPAAIAKSAKKVSQEYRKSFEADSAEFDRFAVAFEELLGKAGRAQRIAPRIANRAWDRVLRNYRAELDGHIARFENTENTYKKHMELKAPSQYWSTKASGHDWRTRMFGGLSAVWAVGAGFGLWFLLSGIYNEAVALTGRTSVAGELIPTNPTLLFILAGQGLIISTIVFWVARVFVRLFLSELHLAMDARERVTMVQCYLAMSEENQVGTDSLNIVLQALFRPTQDGIVKDDASVDLTPGAVISRAIHPPR